jgi:hypothetical protein
MKRNLIVLALLAALLTGLVNPPLASSVNAAPATAHTASIHVRSHTAAFDKTRFLAHLAVAAFLVHYIYNKFKQHKLGRTHIITDIKAAAAALIAYHEMRVAYGIAKSSNSKTLHVLIAPIGALVSAISSLRSKLLHGDTSAVSSVDTQENGFQSLAGKSGFGFKDQQPSASSGFKPF